MEHLTGGASPESSGDNNTLSHPGGSQRHPTSGSSDNSQLPTRHVGGPVFDTTIREEFIWLVSLLCSEVLVAWSGALHVVLYYSSQ